MELLHALLPEGLRILYPTARLIGTDIHYKALGFHMPGLVDEYYVVPKSNQPNYWETTRRIIEKHNIDLAFVQPESEVIAWGTYFKTNGNFPCPVLIPPVDLASAFDG